MAKILKNNIEKY